MNYLIIALFAILNRARGTQFFSLLGSTAEGRILATLFMSLIASLGYLDNAAQAAQMLVFLWASLMFWCVFAWDKYWGAATGQNSGAAMAAVSFVPVDKIMSKIFPITAAMTPNSFRQRLWGLVAMCLRQSLAAPAIIALSLITGHPEDMWFAALTPLLGVWYFIFGYLWQVEAITLAELAVGGSLGWLILKSMGA